jgi:LAO/AO transport system kinase
VSESFEHALGKAVLAGQRRALARAITLIESTRCDHRAMAERLLEMLLPHAGSSIRLGISGVPGVGKSTFIEALGGHVIALGHRLAVLAVDPSSPRSKGSILGDKTRMENLSRHESAFVRPSPSGGSLGGVARRTREALIVCEAAGFDVVIVETVGVGQSETAVADMVDMFLLLMAPGGGDELQGIKKGIVELADALIVNKADGDLKPAAERAVQDYTSALGLLRPARSGWSTPVLSASAQQGIGIAPVWQMVCDFNARMGEAIAQRRALQARAWLWQEVTEELIARFRTHREVAALVPAVERAVAAGRLNPAAAAAKLLKAFLDRDAGSA